MKYVCLIYFDPQKVFDGSPESNAVLAGVGPYNADIQASGHHVVSEALTLPNEAMTVRVRDGKMSATDGPFLETREMLGGFIVIEARDLTEAVQIAARDPFARLGAVEVRPVVDFGKPRPDLKRDR
ncbi:MAG TPA: YciI family protein [Polyangiales bacterium]|nr:YciI family protein [Polyangiales bacterium]